MLTNITSLSCLDNDGAATPLQTFNQNPNLPPGITVGRVNNTDIFCLGDADDDVEGAGQVCYSNIPGVHRALSNFNLNDYKKKPDIDEVEKEEVPFTIEDMDKLVPGMWLKCLYDTDDTKLYEAMYLTSDADQMSPDVEGINTPNTIGVEYHREELEEGDDAQKWVPISWCMPFGFKVYENDNNVDYMAEDNVKELFHRAFKELSNEQNFQGSNDKILFSYSMHEGTIVKDEDKYLKIRWDFKSFPAELDTSQYSTIYSALPISHPAVQQLDNKFKLYQLYKNDPLASAVFPKSYSSYAEALQDTEEAGEDIFYIKDAGATRGDGIYIKTRDELAEHYEQLKEEGEYNVDDGEGDIIIQRAVKDLWTLDGDGPISGRRFDIRFFVLVTKGSVYLHKYQQLRWAFGSQTRYDPNDTNEENQILNIAAFGGGEIPRLFFSDKAGDWIRGKKRWNTEAASNGTFDPHGWRDAVADALDGASGVFDNLKELTKDDPTKYVLVGGDAIIREDGSAVLIEFNAWPHLNCNKEKECKRAVMPSGDSYHVTGISPAAGIIASEAISQLVYDTAAMVMKVQPADEIEGWREVIVRDE